MPTTTLPEIQRASFCAHRILDAADLLITEAQVNPDGSGKESIQRFGIEIEGQRVDFDIPWAVGVIGDDVHLLFAMLATDLFKAFTLACPDAPTFNGHGAENWHVVVSDLGQQVYDTVRTALGSKQVTPKQFQERWPDVARALARLPRFDAKTMHAMLTREAAFAARNHDPTVAEDREQAAQSGMTRKEVAKRMEELRAQGEPWTSQQRMANQIGCSKATINKAIRETTSLHAWAKVQVAPKAQSIHDMVTDRAPQDTELDPVDEAVIREYLERDLASDARAFFNGLSRENQLDFLDDPDKHQRILGRKA